MVCCPSEMTPRMGTGTASLTSPSKVARSPRVLLSKVRASSTSPDKQSRIIQSTSWPTSGCIPSMASSTWRGSLESGLDPLLICQVQCDQFFVAFQQIGDGPLGDAHPTLHQTLMDLGDRAVLPIAQLTNDRDDIQAKFPVGERPGSFFFGSIRQMVQVTLLVAAAPHHQREADQPSEGHQGALGMIGYPEPLSTTHALACSWCQAHFALGRGTRLSSGHLFTPP